MTFAIDTTLYILGGSLTGDGIVMGNLSLSRQGSQGTTGGNVTPGTGGWQNQGQPGTITVAGNFKMWSGADTVTLYVNATGQLRKLEVAGNVQLNGKLYVEWDRDYKPAADTTVQFMTYGGTRTGTFGEYHIFTYPWMVGDIQYGPQFTLPVSGSGEEVSGLVVGGSLGGEQ